MPSRSSSGWSKAWLAGIRLLPPLCGMASAAVGVNALACADWLAQERPLGFATQLPVDPLGGKVQINGEYNTYQTGNDCQQNGKTSVGMKTFLVDPTAGL